MIVKNLISALRTEEEVYINDLGLFKKCFKSSQLEKGILYPPCWMLTFDEKAEGSGFAFTLYVSQHELMKIVDADHAIREWVAQLVEDLKKNKKVHVDGLGTFVRKKNDELSFESELIPELNQEYDGMNPIPVEVVDKRKKKSLSAGKAKKVTAQEVEVEAVPVSVAEPAPVSEDKPAPVAALEEAPMSASEPEPEPVSAVEPEPVESPEPAPVAALEEESMPAPEPEVDEVEKEERKKSWMWVIIIFVLLVIGCLAYLFKNQIIELYNRYCIPQKVSEVVVGEPVGVEMNEVAATDTTVVMDTMLAEMDPEEETPIEVERPPFDINNLQHIDFQSGRYYVVHGSFLNESDCVRHIKNHHFAQYEPFILHQSDKTSRLRICLKVFGSEGEAEAFASTIKGAWVLSE
jgi:hypothetical protein